jgi:CheY-like chemotaxis protein
MYNARIGLFEDYPAMQTVITQWMEHDGHFVVLKAGSLVEALEAIEAAEPGAIDVALVDADLGKNHDEGAEVIKSLREKMGDIAIIGISLIQPLDDADVNIPKGKIEQITKYISEL